jgi:hypothetical protein
MNLSVGIVGLPNVGKSTLFNALLKKQIAFVANFPFATIEPNVGVVPVPDERLEKLAEIVAFEKAGPVAPSSHPMSSVASSLRALDGTPSSRATRFPPIVPATVKFVDIAGLVKGANQGAGLGNKFLSHIREVSIIAHVVRAFEDPNIIREGSVGPKEDYETINTELILADIESLQKSKIMNAKKTSILSSIDGKKQEAIGKINSSLDRGIPVRDLELSEEQQGVIKGLFLLSSKPEIVVLNVLEKDYSEGKLQEIVRRYAEVLKLREEKFVAICAKIEAELTELSLEDQKQYLKDLGLEESGLERLIKKAYETLGLVSFLTAGEKEVRAWTLKKGTKAVDAAGVIHTDFTKAFIKAEVVSYEDFVNLGGWKKARGVGKTRFEGKDYIVEDGDVVEFKIGS